MRRIVWVIVLLFVIVFFASKAFAEITRIIVTGPSSAEIKYKAEDGITYIGLAKRFIGDSDSWPIIAANNPYPARAIPVGGIITIPVTISVVDGYLIINSNQYAATLIDKNDQIKNLQKNLDQRENRLTSAENQLQAAKEDLSLQVLANIDLKSQLSKIQWLIVAVSAAGAVAIAFILLMNRRRSRIIRQHYRDLLFSERVEVDIKGKKMIFFPLKQKMQSGGVIPQKKCFYSTLFVTKEGKQHLVDELGKVGLSVHRTLTGFYVSGLVTQEEKREIEKAQKGDRLGEAQFCH